VHLATPEGKGEDQACNVLTFQGWTGNVLRMTQTSTYAHNWTRALSISTLERIYTQTTDRKAQREIKTELDRRDDEAQA